MSNSRRRTPVTGNTCARSEKQDKILAHRRLRRTVRGRLRPHQVDVLGEDNTEYHTCGMDLRDVSDVWSFDKDGRQRFDPVDYPELMRK